MSCSEDWNFVYVHHGIGSLSSSSESRGRNIPPLLGGVYVPLTLFFCFGGVPLAYRFADLHVPLFRLAFPLTFPFAFPSVWRGVSVAFHPFHNTAKMVGGDRESGVVVEEFAGASDGHVVAP